MLYLQIIDREMDRSRDQLGQWAGQAFHKVIYICRHHRNTIGETV